MAKLPKFNSDQEEAEFWATHDATDFLDETQPIDIQFVDARPPRTRIALHLDPATMGDLQTVARHKGVDSETLIRTWIMEQLRRELG